MPSQATHESKFESSSYEISSTTFEDSLENITFDSVLNKNELLEHTNIKNEKNVNCNILDSKTENHDNKTVLKEISQSFNDFDLCSSNSKFSQDSAIFSQKAIKECIEIVNDESFDISFNEELIDKVENENTDFGTLDSNLSFCVFENDGDIKDKINKSKVITGFKTGHNKDVCVKEESLVKAKNASDALANAEVTTGTLFKMQEVSEIKKNQFIINDETSRLSMEDSFYFNDSDSVADKRIKLDNNEKQQQNISHEALKDKQGTQINKFINIPNLKDDSTAQDEINHQNIKRPNKNNIHKITSIYGNRPMRMYNMPEKGHGSNKNKYIDNMQRSYRSIKSLFRKEPNDWIEMNFKWSWLELFVKGEISDNLEGLDVKLRNIMDKRKAKEYSIFRRIVEGDDISTKYMTVLVLKAYDKSLMLFDGFFTLNATVDSDISRMIISQQIKFGSFLRLVNAELLCDPKSIFEVKDNALKLNYNSIGLTIPSILGYQKKVGFCKYLNGLKKSGGIISALELKITKVIEIKVLVKVGNYINTVEEKDLDKELEKIEKLIHNAKCSETYKPIIKKTAKVLAKDKFSTECLLTWLGCENVAVNEMYRFFNLKFIEKSMGTHLGTIHNRSFFVKIKELG